MLGLIISSQLDLELMHRFMLTMFVSMF